MELKKIKIFKRLMLSIVLLTLTFALSGCNETIPNEGSVTLSLTEAYQNYIEYDDIPSFTLSFDGTLNTIANVNKSYYTVFSKNDDTILSDAIAKLLTLYEGKIVYSVVNEDDVDERKYQTTVDGELKSILMPCDDGKVYDEIAYISLDNGLKLTIDYCRFVSDGKTYYTWRYSQSVSMYLYYPIMRIENNNKIELVLITVPNLISIHVSPELKLANIINKDIYLEDTYYSFEYYEEDDFTLNDKKTYVWNYYDDYQISARSDEFTFIYLNNKFNCKLLETGFTITWKERV